jgi:hypothetical protein
MQADCRWDLNLAMITRMNKLTFTHSKYIKIVLDNCRIFCVQLHDKAIPIQAWTSPEGSRRLRHPDFKTIGT